MKIECYRDADGKLHAQVNREDGRLVDVTIYPLSGLPVAEFTNRRVLEAVGLGAELHINSYPNDYFPAPDPVAAVDAQLAQLDQVMPRWGEDLIFALVANSGFDVKWLPQIMQDRIETKLELRDQRSEIVNLKG